MKKFYSFIKPFLNRKPDYWTDEFKKEFGFKGKRMLKNLAFKLGLTKCTVCYNKAGVACSGDLSLIGLKQGYKQGIYISFNLDFTNLGILYRSVTSIKDYSGCKNNWLDFENLANEESTIQIFNNFLDYINKETK